MRRFFRGIAGAKLKCEPIFGPSCPFPYQHGCGRFVSSSTSTSTSTSTSAAYPTKLPSSNETVVEKFDPLKKDSPCIKLDPRAVFPWRHSSHPLPRLVPNTEEFITEGGYLGPNLPSTNKFFRGLQWINACAFLGANVINYGRWKKEIENAFQHAFAFGVHGVLNDIYHADASGDEEIDKHVSTDSPELGGDDDDDDDDDEAFPIDFNHFVKPEDDYQLKQAEEEEAGNQMIEPSLISLYRSAHTSGKHKLQIKLKSRPKSAKIMSLFVIPFLTRREVKDNISLKHSFRNIVKALHQREQMKGRGLSYFEAVDLTAEMLDGMLQKQMKRLGRNIAQITIIAQVAIQCDELFVVRDSETGDVVQGDPDENINDVTHLVRFEMVVNINANKGVELGSWQITDWDDLIDGNIWFY